MCVTVVVTPPLLVMVVPPRVSSGRPAMFGDPFGSLDANLRILVGVSGQAPQPLQHAPPDLRRAGRSDLFGERFHRRATIRIALLLFANRPVLLRVITCSPSDRVSSTSCHAAS
jgi:hypothetical protein